MAASQTRLALAGHDALLIVDVQNDFLPGGSLAVPDGDGIIPVLNEYIKCFRDRGLPVIATRDWHPPDHCSFQSQGGPWPPHCVRATTGADFPATLVLPSDVVVISKGCQKTRDAYSGFEGTALHEQLRELGVRRLFVGGLATDYCVRATVLDARRLGYEVCLLVDAIRAVDVHAGDGERAIEEMRKAGARPVTREQLQ